MSALVADLLQLARLDAGRPIEAASVDLSRLLVDGVTDAQAAGSEHIWKLDVPEDPLLVRGDAGALAQVVDNLLTNARVHTPRGTVVTVQLEVGAEVQTVARLTVADDGPGIAAELLPEAFERFTRGDTSRSRAAGSSGLGLAIVAAIVEAHHGSVEVASVPGCTEFTITLPQYTETQYIETERSEQH